MHERYICGVQLKKCDFEEPGHCGDCLTTRADLADIVFDSYTENLLERNPVNGGMMTVVSLLQREALVKYTEGLKITDLCKIKEGHVTDLLGLLGA